MSEFAGYIGIPWQAGAQGPHAYDCWAFFRMVQRRYFGIQVPIILATDYDNPTALAGLFREHGETARWCRQEYPDHGCGVIVHKPLHAGIWLGLDGGGVLHCARGMGVIWTPDASWRVSGFGRREFYRFTGDAR